MKNFINLQSFCAIFLSLLVFPSYGFSQIQTYAPETKVQFRRPPEPKKTTSPKAKPEESMQISIQVRHNSPSIQIQRLPVFLRAARVRGPFEPTAPKPKFEWSALTDTNGLARFENIPKNLSEQGLEVHAVVSYDGIIFDSSAETPISGQVIPLKVYERSVNVEGIRFSNIRTMIEVWEDYLVFRQTYSIINRSNFAIDTTMLPGKKLEKGLPITIPIKGQGIRAFGSGSNLIVNSTVFWKGVLLPNRNAQLQIHFSIPVKTTNYTYTQMIDFKTENVEVILPLQTQFKKIPRLNELELRPPGFKETEQGAGIFGLRSDIDFIGARGLELNAGDEIKFQLRGLPFHQSQIPYYVLGLAIIFGIFVFFFAIKTSTQQPTPNEINEMLHTERDLLLEELALLEQDLLDRTITQNEYETEKFATRERLALILKNLSYNTNS